MIKLIVFDFDGTLVDFVNTDLRCLKYIHSQCNAPVNFEKFTDIAIDEIMRFHDLVSEGSIDPLIMHEFRLKNTLSKFDIDWNNRYLENYRKHLFENTIPYEGIVELLSVLRVKVKIGLISNAYDGAEQKKRIICSGLDGYIDKIVISGEVGYSKPSPEIFQTILDQFGVMADEAVFIGDSVKYDVRGAQSVGMHSVLFSYNGNAEKRIADHTCNNIKELCDLLKRLIA